MASDEMKLYDAGLLGGGHLPDADWWQDYLRAEIERANEFCGEQYEHLRAELAEAQRERDDLRCAIFGSSEFSAALGHAAFTQMARNTNAAWRRAVERAQEAERERDALARERDALRVAIFGSDNYSTELTNGSFVQMALDTEAGRKGGVSRAVAAERDRDAAKAEAERLREALNSIAAWDDHGANRALERDGTYGRFDEPGSVQIARAALQEKPHG